MSPLKSRLVGSPACLPQLELDELLDLYSDIGFQKFELFTAWGGASSLPADSPVRFPSLTHPDGDAGDLRRQIQSHGLRVTSMHLPYLTEDDFEDSLDHAVTAAHFAAGLGAGVVLYKAMARDLYARGSARFLHAIAELPLTPVIKNHAGAPISTISDFQQVLTAIADDRMGTLLDVGHLVRAGDSPSMALEQLAGTLALVHVNDIDSNGGSVPFGTGTVDFQGLLHRLADMRYSGDIVVELEIDGHADSLEPTATELRKAVEFLCELAEPVVTP